MEIIQNITEYKIRLPKRLISGFYYVIPFSEQLRYLLRPPESMMNLWNRLKSFVPYQMIITIQKWVLLLRHFYFSYIASEFEIVHSIPLLVKDIKLLLKKIGKLPECKLFFALRFFFKRCQHFLIFSFQYGPWTRKQFFWIIEYDMVLYLLFIFQANRLLEQVVNTKVGLTGLRFFYFTRPLILSVC